MLSAPENCCLCPHKTIYLECLAFHTNIRHLFETTKVNTSQNISKIKEKKKKYDQILHAMKLNFAQNYIILTSEHTQGGKFNILFELPDTTQTSSKQLKAASK